MIADVLKQLRQLPYADMMKLASELKAGLPLNPNLDARVVADALATLSRTLIEESDVTTHENKLLREMFRTKRQITVKEFNGGFDIQCSTLRGQIMHKDLKLGISQMLDTLVAAKALTGGK